MVDDGGGSAEALPVGHPCVQTSSGFRGLGNHQNTFAWDLLHRVGRFKEARTIYLLAQERVEISSHAYPNDLKASIESRLGYTEVQIGLYAAGFRKLHHAIAISPGEMENHERLRKAYVLRQDDHVVPDVAESTLHSVAKEKPAFSAEMKQLQLPRKPPQSVALALQPFVVDSNNHSWPGSSS